MLSNYCISFLVSGQTVQALDWLYCHASLCRNCGLPVIPHSKPHWVCYASSHLLKNSMQRKFSIHKLWHQLYNLTNSDRECEVHMLQHHRCGTSLLVICDFTQVSFAQTPIQAWACNTLFWGKSILWSCNILSELETTCLILIHVVWHFKAIWFHDNLFSLETYRTQASDKTVGNLVIIPK